MIANKTIGDLGERLAVDFLEAKGYHILARNWRYRHLEIDIIASLDSRLHFIEVKTRNSLRFGMPEESITREKMTHMRNAAEAYQYLHPKWKYLQFDVLAITLTDGKTKEILFIEDVYF